METPAQDPVFLMPAFHCTTAWTSHQCMGEASTLARESVQYPGENNVPQMFFTGTGPFSVFAVPLL